MFDAIDILVLNRNYSSFLPDALNSCINQTYKNINVIIVDDNSTDNSKQIILDYCSKQNNFSYFFMEDSNPNISKVRNKLIELSKSKYVAFLSSDDYYHEKFIETSYDLLKNSNPDIGGVYGGFYFVDENKNMMHKVTAKNLTHKKLIHECINLCQCVVYFESSLFKKDIFTKNIKFNEAILVGEENLFIQETVKDYNFLTYTENLLAYKRSHKNSGHFTKKDIWQEELNKIRQIIK